MKLKRYVAGAGIFSIVISKLRHRKKSYLIILLKVDKSLEVGFHCIILPFGLTVHPGVESDEESPLDIKEIA